MFRCPICRRPTISLFRRVAASSPYYPVTCPACGGKSVMDQSFLKTLVWIEAPGLLVYGILRLLTGDPLLATQVTVVLAVVLLPVSLLVAPLRAVAREAPVLGAPGAVTMVKPVFGPFGYVLFLAAVFAVFAWVAGVVVLSTG